MHTTTAEPFNFSCLKVKAPLREGQFWARVDRSSRSRRARRDSWRPRALQCMHIIWYANQTFSNSYLAKTPSPLFVGNTDLKKFRNLRTTPNISRERRSKVCREIVKISGIDFVFLAFKTGTLKHVKKLCGAVRWHRAAVVERWSSGSRSTILLPSARHPARASKPWPSSATSATGIQVESGAREEIGRFTDVNRCVATGDRTRVSKLSNLLHNRWTMATATRYHRTAPQSHKDRTAPQRDQSFNLFQWLARIVLSLEEVLILVPYVWWYFNENRVLVRRNGVRLILHTDRSIRSSSKAKTDSACAPSSQNMFDCLSWTRTWWDEQGAPAGITAGVNDSDSSKTPTRALWFSRTVKNKSWDVLNAPPEGMSWTRLGKPIGNRTGQIAKRNYCCSVALWRNTAKRSRLLYCNTVKSLPGLSTKF